MDAGIRDEEDRLGPGPAPLPFSNQPPQSQHHHALDIYPGQSHLSPTAFDPRPSQPSAAAYVAANAQAVAANANLAADAFARPRDPDAFYRNYHGTQAVDTSLPVSPAIEAMASAVSGSRQLPSLRFNGNGTTPKHPALPAGRTALRPSYRSVSTPADGRPASSAAKQGSTASNGYSGSRQTSVKDLTRRFD